MNNFDLVVGSEFADNLDIFLYFARSVQQQYRWYVLSHISQLNNLDMSTVTNSDRAMITRFFPPTSLAQVKKPPRHTSDE